MCINVWLSDSIYGAANRLWWYFLNNILLKNLHDNGLDVAANQVPIAMLLPAMGMVTGLLIAVFSVTANLVNTLRPKF